MAKRLSKDCVQWMPRNTFPVPIGFCPNKQAFADCMKKYKIKDVEFEKVLTKAGNCSQFYNKEGDLFVLISLSQKPEYTPAMMAGLSAHEAVHAFDEVCQWVGENKPSPELKAYFIQDITEFCFYHHQKCMPKKGKRK